MLTKRERLPNLVNDDVRLALSRSGVQTLEWLTGRLTAELERRVMHRKKEFCPRLFAHSPSLLGRAVKSDPRIVCADRHDNHVNRLITGDAEQFVRVGSITSKQDLVSAGFY